VTAALDDQAIYLVLSEALLSGRLDAGVKLGEQKLATLFGVTRERVRKVLHRLGHERLIEVLPNRGAYVVNPSLEDVREIYEARRIVEGGIAWRVAECLSSEQEALLHAHFAHEEHAHDLGNRAESIRLSGAFHVLLAEMTRNALVIHQLRELVGRTAILVALLEDDSTPRCGVDEHAAILRALASREPAAAARAMTAHLSLIETRLQPRSARRRKADLDATLRAAIEAHARRRSALDGDRAA
jgi:DNA-binding GntR family transcriptional regulator